MCEPIKLFYIEEELKAAFLENLKEARKAAGFSQKEVADKLGKPQSFISKMESGERRVSPIEIFFLSKIYKVDINLFFKGLEEIWEREKRKK